MELAKAKDRLQQIRDRSLPNTPDDKLSTNNLEGETDAQKAIERERLRLQEYEKKIKSQVHNCPPWNILRGLFSNFPGLFFA